MGFELATLVVIGTDYTGSCKSNYHTITALTNPNLICGIYIKCNLHLDISEECSDNEGGCSWEEVEEIYGSGGVVSTMNTRLLLTKCPNKYMLKYKLWKKSLNSDGHQFHQ